jgi:pyruvate/2-oxoglutarate dehydrogenase complex dihydrolipoamide dehydrogenase (E3) component
VDDGSGHAQQPRSIDVEGHVDLRHAARGGGDSDQVELAQELVAVGHEPYTKELGLEKTKVQSDEKGFIR